MDVKGVKKSTKEDIDEALLGLRVVSRLCKKILLDLNEIEETKNRLDLIMMGDSTNGEHIVDTIHDKMLKIAEITENVRNGFENGKEQ